MDTTARAPSPNGTAPQIPEEALDQLLRLIITGFFVLTDGQGALSKWSDPAELLFGLVADDALMEPFFGKLVAPTDLTPEGEAWRAFLENGGTPGTHGCLRVDAHRPGGGTFAMEAVFVPVKLDEGFDFSLFLEDLAFELPVDMMLLRMRQQHPVVIRALRAALADDQPPWEGLRTAGTLVAFRPMEETPWMDAAMQRREEEAAAAEAELQWRIEAFDAPEIQGTDVYDLDDARAVIERLKWATERIEELEERSRISEDALQVAADARVRAEAAERAALDAKAEISGVLADRPVDSSDEASRLELVARLERVERAATEASEAAASQRIASESERTRATELDHQRAELLARLQQLERSAEGDRETTAAVARARAELMHRLEALETSGAGGAEAAQAASSELITRLDAVERARAEEAAATRAELERLRAFGDVRSELEALKAQVAATGELRGEIEAIRARADTASGLLKRGEERDAAARQQAVAEAAGAREQAAAAAQAAGSVRGIAAGVGDVSREVAAATIEPLTVDVAELRTKLAGVGSAVEELRLAPVEAGPELTAALDALRADVSTLRSALEGAEGGDAAAVQALSARLAAVEAAGASVPDGLDTRMESLRDGLSGALGKLETLSVELAATRTASGAGHQVVEQRLADTAAELMAARTDAEQARRGLEGLRDELTSLREYAAAARSEAVAAKEAASTAHRARADEERQADELRTEVKSVLASVQEFKHGFEEARQAAVAARRDAELARSAAERAGAVNEMTTEKFTEVWQKMLTSPAPQRSDSGVSRGLGARATTSRPVREAPPARDPRPGFDDDPRPMAVLDLRGKFTQLNPAFAKLVGYQEHEFGKATWPSVLDRALYMAQRAEFDELIVGERETAAVQSTYMHGQGIMVLVNGAVELVRDDAGRPEHLLLVTDGAGLSATH